MRSDFTRSVAFVLAFAGVPAVAQAAGPGPGINLDPHRAVYELSLESRDSNASVSGVRGRMVHEFNGAECDGYTVSMRWVAQMTNTEGDVSIDDVRFASWEDATGENYSYTSTRYLNDQKIEEVTANAEHGDAGGRVNLSKPQEDNFALPDETVFPTEHLRSVLEAAISGETFAEKVVYDVSEDGRQIYNTMAVVGAPREGRAEDALDTIPGTERLDALRAWRVTVSYFKGGAGGEETPAFEQTFDLFSNGVASSLRLDYGEIVIKGTLSDLEFLTAPSCDEGGARP